MPLSWREGTPDTSATTTRAVLRLAQQQTSRETAKTQARRAPGERVPSQRNRPVPFACFLGNSAEEKGFEPLVQLPVRRFSKPLPSTTRPLLRSLEAASPPALFLSFRQPMLLSSRPAPTTSPEDRQGAPPGDSPRSQFRDTSGIVVRSDGRLLEQHRQTEILPGFQRNAEGSVLYRVGHTVVLCTVSVDSTVPAWMVGRGKGWLSAEYQMHPRASPTRRESRDGRGKAPSGRTQEIQRLIGRALRAAVDLEAFGERTLAIDCDVLEADGGTRTASITGSYVALVLALAHLRDAGALPRPVLREQVAAVSVGHLEHGLALDSVYAEDSRARVDLNLVATARGAIVEVQGTAEGEAVPRADIDRMVDLGLSGIATLVIAQAAAVAAAGIELTSLFVAAPGPAGVA